MENELITVFTPVFNRADKLEKLYQSLLTQTNKRFRWIIINDGSTDDSNEVIQKIVDDHILNITAEHQTNQGKHVAHNRGVVLCKTELFVCVDSDDTLISTAIEEIYDYYNTHRNEIGIDIAGIIAWKGFTEDRKIGKLPKTMDASSLLDLYKKSGMTGDTMLIFRTKVIQQYPFPFFAGEKFLRESISYNKIDEKYKYIILNRILYIADYYEDGLSRNAPRLELKSPRGAALFRWEEYKHSTSAKEKTRSLISYVFFNRLAKNNHESFRKLGIGFLPCWVASWSGYIHYKKYR